MIHLGKNEKVLMVLHRHWIVIMQKISIGVLLLILPAFTIPAIRSTGIISTDHILPYLGFATVIYTMIITLFIFTFWINYYLDMWIITSERIIDIEQKGLFNRQVSEFALSRVQDITIVIPNITATFMRYGDIVIQTAGEKSFSINQIPNVYKAKDLILDQAKKIR